MTSQKQREESIAAAGEDRGEAKMAELYRTLKELGRLAEYDEAMDDKFKRAELFPNSASNSRPKARHGKRRSP